MAARLYQGQTTNSRTPGGGFAPVYSSADMPGASAQACASGGGSHGAAAHASYGFLRDESSGVHPVPHALYVAPTRSEATAGAMAGQTLRLADWFVRLKCDAPDVVVNETYSLVRFDARGRVDPARAPSAAQTHTTPAANLAWPTTAERERLRPLLFGKSPSPDASCASYRVN